VLDDFGTQNATGWAQEKLFQIVNYRYINKLSTVITTNLALDEIEAGFARVFRTRNLLRQYA
jgi:DNA replication protein DnaC